MLSLLPAVRPLNALVIFQEIQKVRPLSELVM